MGSFLVDADVLTDAQENQLNQGEKKCPNPK
jgi:hypothetical protein